VGRKSGVRVHDHLLRRDPTTGLVTLDSWFAAVYKPVDEEHYLWVTDDDDDEDEAPPLPAPVFFDFFPSPPQTPPPDLGDPPAMDEPQEDEDDAVPPPPAKKRRVRRMCVVCGDAQACRAGGLCKRCFNASAASPVFKRDCPGFEWQGETVACSRGARITKAQVRCNACKQRLYEWRRKHK
jgi:hypothetical protein